MALGPPGGVDALVARCPTAAEVVAIAADLSLSFEHDPSATLQRPIEVASFLFE